MSRAFNRSRRPGEPVSSSTPAGPVQAMHAGRRVGYVLCGTHERASQCTSTWQHTQQVAADRSIGRCRSSVHACTHHRSSLTLHRARVRTCRLQETWKAYAPASCWTSVVHLRACIRTECLRGTKMYYVSCLHTYVRTYVRKHIY